MNEENKKKAAETNETNDIKQMFYTVCLVRIGPMEDRIGESNKQYEYYKLRKELYPDYVENNAIPCMPVENYITWCMAREVINETGEKP